MEKEMATHPNILAYEIPRTEELQSMGSQRVGHDLATRQQQHVCNSWDIAWLQVSRSYVSSKAPCRSCFVYGTFSDLSSFWLPI